MTPLEGINNLQLSDRIIVMLGNETFLPSFKHAARISAMLTFTPTGWFNLLEVATSLRNFNLFMNFFHRVGHAPVNEIVSRKEFFFLEYRGTPDVSWFLKVPYTYMLFDLRRFREKFVGEDADYINRAASHMVADVLSVDWIGWLDEGSQSKSLAPRTEFDSAFTLRSKLPPDASTVIHGMTFLALEGLDVPEMAQKSKDAIHAVTKDLCKRPQLSFSLQGLMFFAGVLELGDVRNPYPGLKFSKIDEFLNKEFQTQEDVAELLAKQLNTLYSKKAFVKRMDKKINEIDVPADDGSIMEAGQDQRTSGGSKLTGAKPAEREGDQQGEVSEPLIPAPNYGERVRYLDQESVNSIFASQKLGEFTNPAFAREVKYEHTFVVGDGDFDPACLVPEMVQTREFSIKFHPSSFRQMVHEQMVQEKLAFNDGHWQFPCFFDFRVVLNFRYVYVDVEDEYRTYFNFPLRYPQERLKKKLVLKRQTQHLTITREEFMNRKSTLQNLFEEKLKAQADK